MPDLAFDKKLARIIVWLQERGLTMHCYGTAKSSKSSVRIVLREKRTDLEPPPPKSHLMKE